MLRSRVLATGVGPCHFTSLCMWPRTDGLAHMASRPRTATCCTATTELCPPHHPPRPPAPGSLELRHNAATARVLVLRLPLEAEDLSDAPTIAHVLTVLLKWGRVVGRQGGGFVVCYGTALGCRKQAGTVVAGGGGGRALA
jgi:hypothetical protein